MWSRHERAAKRHGFCRSDPDSLRPPPPESRPDFTARYDPTAPWMPTSAPPYSLPQAQTFSIFKGTGHQKSGPPAGTQSPGPDSVWSLGQGVYPEGSYSGRRMMCGEKSPEDRWQGAGRERRGSRKRVRDSAWAPGMLPPLWDPHPGQSCGRRRGWAWRGWAGPQGRSENGEGSQAAGGGRARTRHHPCPAVTHLTLGNGICAVHSLHPGIPVTGRGPWMGTPGHGVRGRPSG